ncbi:MAG: hypothetical protein JWN46_313, partial [Acidimicrobiales bacterium]|nr:hypothetical protein [Acidimicrobiales bacterium]
AALALLAVAGAGAVGAYASLAALRGPPYGWLVRGIWPIAAWVWIACLWTLGRAAVGWLVTRSGAEVESAGHGARVVGASALVAVLAVVVASTATTWATTLGARQADARARATARIAPAAVAAARRAGGAYLYPLPIGGQETWGLVLALDRAGVRWTDDLDQARDLRITIGVAVGAQAIADARRAGRQLLAEAVVDGPGPVGDRTIAAVAAPLDVERLRVQLGHPKPPIR